MFKKLLIATDGSKHSERAMEVAAGLALGTEAQVRVVHVREVTSPIPSVETRREAAALVDDAVAELVKQGVDVSSSLRDAKPGHIASEILGEADDWGADLIVLGHRGLSDLAGLVIGSTTHKLLHLADLPVLVVR